MENVKLRVVIVSEKGRFVKEIMSECNFYNDCPIPHIIITDYAITSMVGVANIWVLQFYDIKDDKFNFEVSDLMELVRSSNQVPSEIRIELLEIADSSGKARYILLEPGLWKEDVNGKYRMCDNSIRHIIMETKILPMIESNQIGWDDGAVITLLAYLENNLEFTYFGNREEIDDEEYYNDDYEDDSDSVEAHSDYCDATCERYNKEKNECGCNKCKDCPTYDSCIQPCHFRDDESCDECDNNCDDCNECKDCTFNLCINSHTSSKKSNDKPDVNTDKYKCCRKPEYTHICVCTSDCSKCTDYERKCDDCKYYTTDCDKDCENCYLSSHNMFKSQTKKSKINTTSELPKVVISKEQYRKFKRR